MEIRKALKLQNEDEVIIKKSKEAMRIIETKTITDETGRITKVIVMLEDGNWYNHKEIK